MFSVFNWLREDLWEKAEDTHSVHRVPPLAVGALQLAVGLSSAKVPQVVGSANR